MSCKFLYINCNKVAHRNANSYNMKELISAAVNRFLFLSLHKVNSNCVSQNRASFVRAALIEKQFLHPLDHEARCCCQTSSHCSDNLQWQHWLSRGRFNIEENLRRLQQRSRLAEYVEGRTCRWLMKLIKSRWHWAAPPWIQSSQHLIHKLAVVGYQTGIAHSCEGICEGQRLNPRLHVSQH